jgi:hypothetical protein
LAPAAITSGRLVPSTRRPDTSTVTARPLQVLPVVPGARSAPTLATSSRNVA